MKDPTLINRIIQCDCLDYMRAMPAGCIDAVITDPPYCSGGSTEAGRTGAKGQGLRSETIRKEGWFKGDKMGTSGLMWLLRAAAFESMRLLKNGNGSMLVFCDWRMAPNLIPAIESSGMRYQNLIVWDKKGIALGTGFRPTHELIMHMTAGSPEFYDKSASNVIRCSRVSSDDREHQTQKPVELIAQLVRVVCPPGGTVLDPFAGSCTLAEACEQTGRNYICLEREREHVITGEARVHQTQPDLATAIA